VHSIRTIAKNRRALMVAPLEATRTVPAIVLALPVVAGPLLCPAWRGHDMMLGALSSFVLLALLVPSSITNSQQHVICNWTTYSAVLWALVINIVATLSSSGESVLVRAYDQSNPVGLDVLGDTRLAQALLGAVLCCTIALLGYRLSGSGARGIKPATAVGALLGARQGVRGYIAGHTLMRT
jgi:hypothetical protein